MDEDLAETESIMAYLIKNVSIMAETESIMAKKLSIKAKDVSKPRREQDQ